MDDLIFTPDDVKHLTVNQRRLDMHPFTCPNRGDGFHFEDGRDLGVLVPTVRGWICQYCDYTQAWAHEHMKHEMPRSTFPGEPSPSAPLNREEVMELLGATLHGPLPKSTMSRVFATLCEYGVVLEENRALCAKLRTFRETIIYECGLCEGFAHRVKDLDPKMSADLYERADRLALLVDIPQRVTPR